METSSARSSISHSTDLEETESISTPCTESDNQTDELESLPADALEASEVNDDQRPLFLHLTCSCHYKSQVGNTIRPISVTTLPTCLGESELGLYIFILSTKNILNMIG